MKNKFYKLMLPVLLLGTFNAINIKAEEPSAMLDEKVLRVPEPEIDPQKENVAMIHYNDLYHRFMVQHDIAAWMAAFYLVNPYLPLMMVPAFLANLYGTYNVHDINTKKLKQMGAESFDIKKQE